MKVAEIEKRPQTTQGGHAMKMFRAHIKLVVNSTKVVSWIDYPAANAVMARAQLERLYGKENVLSVIKGRG